MRMRQDKNIVGHLIVSLVAISVFLGNISHSGLWYPSAPSHALNGVFYEDVIHEGGFLDPVKYAERYYVQYPSLTAGIYPPVFYIVEALFFRLFGVSHLVAKLAVLSFTLLGVNVFFLLSRLWFPLGLSIVGSVLFLLQPSVLFAQKNVMLEMPALAVSMIALYFLYLGIEMKKTWALLGAPVFSALAILTKQNAIFLIPIWLFWIIMRKKWAVVKSGHFMTGVLIGTLILMPWVVISLTIGRPYVAVQVLQEHHIWDNCVYYISHFPQITSYAVILLSIPSIILFVKLKEYNSYKFAILWGASVFFCLLLIDYREARFATFMVPALIILCMHGILLFREKSFSFFQRRKVYTLLVIVLICLHLNPDKVIGGPDIDGVDRVADLIVRDEDCMAVLYDGYFNGNFVFHMRARDEDRRIFVFRASKVIFSTKWSVQLGYNELVSDVSRFHETLKRYSVKYIVQEERDLMNTPANRRLRQWIQGPEFKLVGKYSVLYRSLYGLGNLLVYEYLDYEGKPLEWIDLDMPVMGRKIRVKLERR